MPMFVSVAMLVIELSKKEEEKEIEKRSFIGVKREREKYTRPRRRT